MNEEAGDDVTMSASPPKRRGHTMDPPGTPAVCVERSLLRAQALVARSTRRSAPAPQRHAGNNAPATPGPTVRAYAAILDSHPTPPGKHHRSNVHGGPMLPVVGTSRHHTPQDRRAPPHPAPHPTSELFSAPRLHLPLTGALARTGPHTTASHQQPHGTHHSTPSKAPTPTPPQRTQTRRNDTETASPQVRQGKTG